jgi:hypothetical protein
LFLILMGLGIVGLVGYLLAVEFLSGSQLAEFPIQSGSAIGIGGVSVSTHGAAQRESSRIQLEPSMNPLRLNLSFTETLGIPSVAMSIDPYRYTVSMRDAAGKEVWKREGRMSRDQNRKAKAAVSSHTISIATFNVDRAGEFYFTADVATPQGQLVNATLSLRRNVAEVNVVIAMVLGAVALIGLLGFVLGGRS